MDERTLTALQGSIEKWKAIEAGTGSDKGTGNCPLCQLFVETNHPCQGCPVERATGLDACDGTPYELWGDMQRERGNIFPYKAYTKALIGVARAERKFLESLLPSEPST